MEPKMFKQWRPAEGGGREWNLRGVEPLPYKLPECLHCDDQPLIVVEGEKDVETLWTRGFVATCNSGGAGKWKKEFVSYFAGRDVVVIPDNDAPGEKHAQQVLDSFAGVAKSARILRLDGLAEKGDVTDWFAAGNGEEQFRALIAPPTDEVIDESGFIRSGPDLVWPGDQRWVIEHWIPEDYATLLYGHGGASKSFLALHVAMQIATGGRVFGREVQQGPVLFLDGELNDAAWLRRAFMLANGMGRDTVPEGIIYYQVDRSILEPKLKAKLTAFIKKHGIVLTIIDSFTACLPGDDTNSLDDVSARMRALREFGSTLVVDHMAKGNGAISARTTGTAIGSSAKMMFTRAAFQVTAVDRGAVIKHTKPSFGPKIDDVGYQLDVQGRCAVIREVDPNGMTADIKRAPSAAVRIFGAFEEGRFPDGATVSEVAETLDIKLRTTRNTLNDLRNEGCLLHSASDRRYRLPLPTTTSASL
jgi:hypothetical protein